MSVTFGKPQSITGWIGGGKRGVTGRRVEMTMAGQEYELSERTSTKGTWWLARKTWVGHTSFARQEKEFLGSFEARDLRQAKAKAQAYLLQNGAS